MRDSPRSTRGRVVLLALLGAGLGLVASGRTWAHGTVEGLTTHTASATGAQAYPGLAALVTVAAAAAVAATLAGWRMLRLLGAILAVVGVVLGILAGRALAAPAWLLETAGEAGGATEVTGITAGWGGLLALLSGALLVIAGVAMWRGARRWTSAAGRYTSAGAPEPDLWDALSRGEDPTSLPAEAGESPNTCKN